MRAGLFVMLMLCLAVGPSTGCSTRRVGKRTPAARADKGVVQIRGTRRVVGEAGDTGYSVRVVRVDGAPARRSQLVLDPGVHQIQVSWSRLELPDAFSHGLGRDFEPSTRWVKTAGGCCTVDVDVRAGRVYTLVWDERRTGRCPFCVVEVPQCP